MKKKILLEAAGIFIISGLAGIIYNFFSGNPLPLIFKKPEVVIAHDSLLSFNTPAQTKDTAGVQPVKVLNRPDTVKLASKDNEKAQSKSSDPNIKKTESEAVKNVSYKQVLSHLEDENFLFIDARHPANYLKGKIGNAINIDAYPDDMNEYFRVITQLPRHKIIIVYCDGGDCDASHKLAKDIISFGYPKVFVYQGGWDEWKTMQKIPD